MRLISKFLVKGGRRIGKSRLEFRFRDFAEKDVCASGHKAFATVLWLFGGPLDTLIESLHCGPDDGECEETRMRGLAELVLAWAAVAQVIKDGGNWKNGWPLSLSSEMPWGVMDRPQATVMGDRGGFSELIPQDVVTAIRPFRKDVKGSVSPRATQATTPDPKKKKKKKGGGGA